MCLIVYFWAGSASDTRIVPNLVRYRVNSFLLGGYDLAWLPPPPVSRRWPTVFIFKMLAKHR